MTQPLQPIDAPARGEYRFGLYSAAGVADPADQKEFWGGGWFEAICPDVPMPVTAQDVCAEHPVPDLVSGVPNTEATPLRLYTGVICDPQSDVDLIERARQLIEVSEQQSLEQYAWSGAPGNRPRLADPATPVLGGSAVTPVSLARGVGLLEAWIGDNAGSGVIWAPRWTAGFWAEASLLTLESGVRKTAPAGSPVVLASVPGGVGPGPTGADPDAGNAWLYATGPVLVRRSRVLLPDLAAALNRTTNDVFALAQRSYLVGWSCGAAAVQVALPDAEAPAP